ncbi:hypothetical protein FKM82_012319 [Ascaphus truei]
MCDCDCVNLLCDNSNCRTAFLNQDVTSTLSWCLATLRQFKYRFICIGLLFVSPALKVLTFGQVVPTERCCSLCTVPVMFVSVTQNNTAAFGLHNS